MNNESLVRLRKRFSMHCLCSCFIFLNKVIYRYMVRQNCSDMYYLVLLSIIAIMSQERIDFISILIRISVNAQVKSFYYEMIKISTLSLPVNECNCWLLMFSNLTFHKYSWANSSHYNIVSRDTKIILPIKITIKLYLCIGG